MLTPSRDQNIERIVDQLVERFGGELDRDTIEAEVHDRYDELCQVSAFDDFVPILAARRSLDDLRDEAEPESAGAVAARLTAAAADAAGEPGTDPARAATHSDVVESIPITGR